MSQRESRRLNVGKGCLMRFLIDDSQDPKSIHHHWSETSYDGQPDSWVIEIGDHWHKHHDEYMQVLSGRIAFRMDGEEVILTPSDAALHIPRLHVHGFKFFAGEPATFTEKTDPPGSFKEDFFTDIFEEGQPTFFTAMRDFYDGDTYIALPGGFQLLEQAVTTVLGGVAKWWHPRQSVMPSVSEMIKKDVL